MPEVVFHFNAPDTTLSYLCRFARKATAREVGLAITGPQALLQTLSQQLWAPPWPGGASEFLAHAHCDSDAATTIAHSPIVLACDVAALQTAWGAARCQQAMLINLHADVPAQGEAFARVVEIVAADADAPTREAARSRWRTYAARGWSIVRHDLQAQRP